MTYPPSESDAGVIGRLARFGLLLGALAAALFYWSLFRRDNAAPVVDIKGYAVAAPANIAYAIDSCWSTPRKIAVRGWITRKGAHAGRRSMRVVAVDEASGEARGLRTVLQERPEITEMLERRFGGRGFARPGFVASLNLKFAEQPLRGHALFAAYDDGRVKALIPLKCRIGVAP